MYDSTVMRRERAAASVAVVPMPICRSLVTAGLEDTVQRPPSQHLAQRSRYDKTVIHSDYPGFFAAVAATAAALTGLLFVAMSVAARHDPGYIPPVIQQVRAAAALLAFVNALAVSLFGLVPGNGLGIPATVLGVAGILFTAAGARSIGASPLRGTIWLRQFRLVNLLLLIFGTELVAGILLIADPRRSTPLQLVADALVASLLVGISRAWELVGDRGTGIFTSIALLSGHSERAHSDAPDRHVAAETARPAPEDHDAGDDAG